MKKVKEEKEEKQKKAKEEKEEKQNQPQEPIILCKAILKSGINKGRVCGCKLYSTLHTSKKIEELIGEFTTSLPNQSYKTQWLEDGTYLAAGTASLRNLNRLLNLKLPLDGPRTLNGLLLETLQEIPDNDLTIKLGDCVMDIIHFDQQSIKTVRIHQPNKVGFISSDMKSDGG